MGLLRDVRERRSRRCQQFRSGCVTGIETLYFAQNRNGVLFRRFSEETIADKVQKDD